MYRALENPMSTQALIWSPYLIMQYNPLLDVINNKFILFFFFRNDHIPIRDPDKQRTQHIRYDDSKDIDHR